MVIDPGFRDWFRAEIVERWPTLESMSATKARDWQRALGDLNRGYLTEAVQRLSITRTAAPSIEHVLTAFRLVAADHGDQGDRKAPPPTRIVERVEVDAVADRIHPDDAHIIARMGRRQYCDIRTAEALQAYVDRLRSKDTCSIDADPTRIRSLIDGYIERVSHV